MARRSSARLRARNSVTPQPTRTTDLYQDDQLRTPKTAPQLAAVAEAEEMPGAFPASASPNDNTPTKVAKHIADALGRFTRTPKTKPARPSPEEMHPEKFHASTSKPVDEGRWLGFSAMIPQTEPPKGVGKWAPGVDTPTKAARPSNNFEFTFRAQSLELSNEAQKMMAEKREEAARIKRQMMRIEEEKQETGTAHGRKIAQPKGKAGRFSDVHLAEFNKMDSISTHAAASRPGSRDQPQPQEGTSLKRTASKSGIARPQPKKHERTAEGISDSPSQDEGASPAKRVRLDPSVRHEESSRHPAVKIMTPSVQNSTKTARFNTAAKSRLTTPTRSSMARAATVKANKISMIPSLVRTPSKSASKAQPSASQPGEAFWLGRSPTKFAHMSAKKEAPREAIGSPLLAKSPSKSGFGDLLRPHGTAPTAVGSQTSDGSPLLARSPARMTKVDTTDYAEPQSKTPLLARSPSKAPAESNPLAALKTTPGPQTNLMDRFKLLRQSPIKSILRSPQRLYSNDPAKIASGTHLATPPVNKSKNEQNRVGLTVPATEPIVKHVDFTASTKSNDESPLPAKASIIEPERQLSMYPTLPNYPTLPQQSPLSTKNPRRQTLGPLAFTGGASAGQNKDFTFRATPQTSIIFGSSIPAAQSPKPSIRHVSAEPETASSMTSRKRKFVEEATIDENEVFRPTTSRNAAVLPSAYGRPDKGSGSDKENDVNTANMQPKKSAGKARQSAAEAEDGQRPSKKVKRNPSTASNAAVPVHSARQSGSVPSWAQGTAAQKARAALSAAGKKRTTASGAKPLGKTARPSSAVVKRGTSVEREVGGGNGVGVERKDAGGKVVLSRARLDALSQPKRRVGT